MLKEKLKFIVDTGATHSIVNPGICDPKWKIDSARIALKTLQNEVFTDTVYQIPMFSELGDTRNRISFIECRFHNYYDGIIGNDVLRTYNALIDYHNDELRINGKIVPLVFPKPQKVKFISKIESGLIHILEHCNSVGRTISNEGIYDALSFKVEVETFAQCADVIYLKADSYWPVTCENYYLLEERLTQDNVSDLPIMRQIGTDHLNVEEELNLRNLLNNYCKLFYGTNSNLTFTNAIKH